MTTIPVLGDKDSGLNGMTGRTIFLSYWKYLADNYVFKIVRSIFGPPERE
jgi:hypothetical protein